MANFPKYTDDDLSNKGMEVDFNLKKVFDMPTIEQMIFFHVNFDKCRKEIIQYESARNSINKTIKHPKETKAEALNLLKCHSENLSFEPACLESFNDSRECLFKLEGQMRLCHNELELFEECVHDPVRFDKFTKLATPAQRIPKEFFTSYVSKDYWN
mmetsp:Transcript_1275/g.1149  ORF Transcript_1275/g.1149 Transcript_1275/m.1149 type:complete len:157 (+) Transcript_1275:42-512(+)